ncbi:MAG: terminase large subunit [Actinomycetota bacterium]|nr:terminase large subunit [Actinomycetota bacterium]
MTTRVATSPERRWRPRGRRGPACGYTFDDKSCSKKGAHYCEPRADRVVGFFAELLVHTRGPYARQQFVLEDWQEREIVRPVFGEVVWSEEWRRYVRRYRIAGIIVPRKNGKSHLLAGILLFLLVGDDEESAEIYGGARDTKQAGKVWEPAWRMVQLSPTLRKRLGVNRQSRRIFDEQTASYYEIVTADALGELGHNPHGVAIDELLSQRDDSLWNALRTAAGARVQPLFVVASTETNDPESFGAEMIDELERVQEDPSRAPHIFAFVRKLPFDADPWDEANWRKVNPALGTFLSLEALRQEALEARLDPTKENVFRQYRLCQRVQQVTRWMPLHVWDQPSNCQLLDDDKLVGRRCFGGIDLAATIDLAAAAWVFPDGDAVDVLWRFWLPQAAVAELDRHLGGKASVWVREGLLTATPGDVIDYERIHEDLARDAERFEVVEVGYDPWGAEPTRQWLEQRGLVIYPVQQTYRGLSGPLKELMRLAQSGKLRHGGNPVARWHADSIEVKQDENENIRPVKPERRKSGKRIDGLVALTMALAAWQRFEEQPASVYETRGLRIL